jgi:hypothetical protein
MGRNLFIHPDANCAHPLGNLNNGFVFDTCKLSWRDCCTDLCVLFRVIKNWIFSRYTLPFIDIQLNRNLGLQDLYIALEISLENAFLKN